MRQLWATIIINRSVYYRLVGPEVEKLTSAASFYETCMRRSKSAPLDVTIDLYSLSSWTNEWELHQLLTMFMEQTREHAARWTEFVWKHNTHFPQGLLKCLPQELPSLQRLTISKLDWYINSDGRQFPTCPNLHTLTLISIRNNSDGGESTLFQRSGALSIKDLTVGYDQP